MQELSLYTLNKKFFFFFFKWMFFFSNKNVLKDVAPSPLSPSPSAQASQQIEEAAQVGWVCRCFGGENGLGCFCYFGLALFFFFLIRCIIGLLYTLNFELVFFLLHWVYDMLFCLLFYFWVFHGGFDSVCSLLVRASSGATFSLTKLEDLFVCFSKVLEGAFF